MNEFLPCPLFLCFPLATLVGGLVGFILYRVFYKREAKQSPSDESQARDWEISSDD